MISPVQMSPVRMSSVKMAPSKVSFMAAPEAQPEAAAKPKKKGKGLLIALAVLAAVGGVAFALFKKGVPPTPPTP